MRDYTLGAYRELCVALKERHEPVTVAGYLQKRQKNAGILRHDVDAKPLQSLKTAKIESSLDIRSTYYFRTKPSVYREDIIRDIAEMGHEIGFHYETMDKARGDPEKAIAIFAQELAAFPVPVKTVCMHGNPMSPWDNRDLWKHYSLEDYGVAEAYLSIDYSDIMYFSDTGRRWDGRYSVKDVTGPMRLPGRGVKTTKDLMEVLLGDDGKVCIATHPQRWDDSVLPWAREYALQSTKNAGKKLIRAARTRAR